MVKKTQIKESKVVKKEKEKEKEKSDLESESESASTSEVEVVEEQVSNDESSDCEESSSSEGGNNDELNDKILLCYNKYLSTFIKTHKNIADEVKSIVKKFKVIDNNSLEYMHIFDIESVSETLYKQKLNKIDEIKLFKNKDFLNLNIYNGITIKMIYDKLDNDVKKLELLKYTYIFHVLKYLHNLEDGKYKQLLFNIIIDVIDETQFVNYPGYVENIVDDELCDMIKQFILLNILIDNEYKNMEKSANDKGNGQGGIDDEFMSSIENSNIGKLAKEIAEDVNIDDLNIKEPQDLLKGLMGNGEDGQPPILQKIFSTIGTKITAKMENGELNQQELVSDAFNMIGQMNNEGGNNPLSSMFNQMLGQMGNMKGMGKGMGGNQNARTRVNKDRLSRENAKQRARATLEKRQKEKTKTTNE